MSFQLNFKFTVIGIGSKQAIYCFILKLFKLSFLLKALIKTQIWMPRIQHTHWH